ncbi:MAG: pilus assembly PilX family protein [Nitrospiraceae bacterium]
MSERHNGSQVRDERGVSLITVMMVILIMTLMGISILSVTGFERQISGSVSANEASVAAAESCVSTGANVLKQFQEVHVVPPAVLSNAVPPGPVPLANLAVLNSELFNDGGNPDFPVGAGSAPNLTMTVGGYQVFGDIDRLYFQCAFGFDCSSASPNPRRDYYFQITCVAQNLATGITSQVGALFVCHDPGNFCAVRPY